MKIEWRKGAITLPLVAIAALTAGCGGDSGAAGDTGSDGAAGAAPGGGALVSVATVQDAHVLVDAEGRTLYGAAAEKHGDIRCVAACESFWVPAPADQADLKGVTPGLSQDVGVVDRPDGTSQLTFDGQPLYTFSQEDAGELTGDGFTDDFQ